MAGGLLLRREPGSDSEESRRSDLADACGAGEPEVKGGPPGGNGGLFFWAQERGQGR